jgi:hypothetical protein
MAEILAEAGRITGLGPEIDGKIIFGVQSAYAKQTGQKPVRFVAPTTQLTGLDDHDLVIVRFSHTDHSTMTGPLPVASLSLA